MTKILLVSEIFPPVHGGSGRWFSEIYGRFPAGSVCFMVDEHPRAEEYDRTFSHTVYRKALHSSEWGIRSIRGLRFYVRAWRHLRRIVKKEGITEVHCGRCLPEGLAALMLRFTHRLPYRCYVHGEDVEVALNSREHTWLTRLVMKYAKQIICNSQNSHRILLEKWQLPETKMLVMTPGVDIDRFSPTSQSDRPLSWRGKLVILTVGRLQKRKGQDMMIRALPELKKRFGNLHYAIVGGGEEQASLAALCKELGVVGNVEFLGEPNDDALVRWYQQCDVFALPNRRVGNDDEGFGMVLLEAQACGKPVLAGASGGTRETLNEGVTGKLVDCRSAETLAAGLTLLIEDSQALAAMGSEARQHVVGKFSWQVLAAEAKLAFQQQETKQDVGH